jgi:hypothetical protein
MARFNTSAEGFYLQLYSTYIARVASTRTPKITLFLIQSNRDLEGGSFFVVDTFSMVLTNDYTLIQKWFNRVCAKMSNCYIAHVASTRTPKITLSTTEVVQQYICAKMTNCSSLTRSRVQGHGDSVWDNHIGCRLQSAIPKE